MREGGSPFDIIVEGVTPGDDPGSALDTVAPWAAAGATWWLESKWDCMNPADLPLVRRRIEQGPPC